MTTADLCEVRDTGAACTPLTAPQTCAELTTWLTQELPNQSAWMLAYCENGLVWGYWNQATLTTSAELAETYPYKKVEFAALDFQTLSKAHIFNNAQELRVWRSGATWQAARINDLPDPLVENQILWGTKVLDCQTLANHAWTLLSDGRQGFYQWVPVAISSTTEFRPHSRPLRLKIHHNVGYDQACRAYITHSRLVEVWTHPKEQTHD